MEEYFSGIAGGPSLDERLSHRTVMIAELVRSLWPRRHAFSLPSSSMLNLGCGESFHADWANYDCTPVTDAVRQIDLGRPLPFTESSCEVCYMSHVLEHLPRQRVPILLAEVFAALKPGGILRVVVPDLENIARLYLSELEAAAAGDRSAGQRHEWMTLEMIDQMTRSFSGGFMLRTMWSRPLQHRAFIEQRVGLDGQRWIELADKDESSPGRRLEPSQIYAAQEPTGSEFSRFRQTGEHHRWMYDRVSLGGILKDAGFRDVRVCRADESAVAHFSTYHLDTDESGAVRKPDSLFMEARKPPFPS